MNTNTAHRCVLLTGATGFLGAQIARQLLREKDLTVIALVRAEDMAAAARRLSRAWWDWPELNNALTPHPPLPFRERGREGVRVEALAGDVSLPHLGLDDGTYSLLARRITHIIHAAADLRVNAPLDELRKTNVQGTANVLELAYLAHEDHRLERFAHVSTAYVAGASSGSIDEADLTSIHGFNNAYELSKYQGECLVQAAKRDLPISVFRPGMIVGASDTGEIKTFNTFYYPLRLYFSGKYPLIPVDPSLPVNIIPVDYVAEAIVRLTFNPEAIGLTFHLTAPSDSMPKAGELVEFLRAWAREHLGLRLPKPVLVKLPLPKRQYQPDRGPQNWSEIQSQAKRKPRWSELNGLLTLLPYFIDHKQFQRDNVDRLLGSYRLDWHEFLPNLLSFAINQGFMHRTERTVHEQLLVRLQSKTRPIKYFDIVQGKIIPRNSSDVRREILAAAGALIALGIQPEDRVAIVGLNSTRYLELDTAIGLVGAVSVPLYYTSPAADIDHILTASGSRLLLVGAPKILDILDEIKTDLPIVSFYREPAPANLGREVISWEAFLALGIDYKAPDQSQVGLNDLATLRYSSGTTGKPKGVSFQHHHLRWMGQTMASLMPLKVLNKKADYLSFLPMNHVTEGILAMYCPYYVPVAVNIYFLEDLYDIQNVLPRVRPTLFFSVPRIFERIWEKVETNPIGRRYLTLPAGKLKRAIGSFVGWQTLRNAGLDRCAQLISGSAPCGEGLLENFRELGIEIHDAFGMTEAPLVTMNRLGANHLGTVGKPLPETEIRIAEDGEVLVRGPQVMAGYFEGKADEKIVQPFRDGWLLTGDLGSITPDCNLVLKGRKKELFKTSYGKYVQPAKIESLLREIPGVDEAMLVGEERPYCTALLWVQDKALYARVGNLIDLQISQVNRGLSHPEQVKRWAVLANDLSIDGGDLTANLKLRRQAITRRLDYVLKGLYDGGSPAQVVLHVGQAGNG